MDTKKIHLDRSGKMVEGISPTIQPFEIARFDRYDRQADVAAESLSEEAV